MARITVRTLNHFDRHIIEVGESLEYLSFRLNQEGLSDEQIASSVGVPVAFVRASIEGFQK